MAKIEELFSELDAGEESLRRARRQLGIYRLSLLKQAFEGKLTAPWRAQNPDLLESPDQLLTRIQEEREARYEERLKEWEEAVKNWKANAQAKKKPSKPKLPKSIPPLDDDSLAKLPSVPTVWKWIRLADTLDGGATNGIYRPANAYGRGTWIVRIDDFYDGKLIRKDGFKRLALGDGELDSYEAPAGDLLVNRVNSMEYLGKC